MTSSIESEPIWCKEYKDSTDVVWYFDNIERNLTPETRSLLENYSHIPSADILQHIYRIREMAWAVRSHMCTGQGLFLNPTMPLHPCYRTILSRLRNGAAIIDIGTFIGQDLRRLVFDGAPSTNMYAVDIVNHWDIGYSMFRDRSKFHAKYIESDILHPATALQKLYGKIDIIWITHVLHQWTWEGQVMAAKSLVKLSRVGTIVVGYQVGADVANLQMPTELMKAESYLHDPDSFGKMWDEVGDVTGSKWKTSVQYKGLSEMGWQKEDLPTPGRRVIQFIVERIE